ISILRDFIILLLLCLWDRSCPESRIVANRADRSRGGGRGRPSARIRVAGNGTMQYNQCVPASGGRLTVV
ncbi:MAG: hypothetical protein ACYSUQ_11390, partial [Planctomycetota bacterium]